MAGWDTNEKDDVVGVKKIAKIFRAILQMFKGIAE